MRHNYESKRLVVIDGNVYVYNYEKCKFDHPFLPFQPKHMIIGKSKVCPMTEFSVAANNSPDFDGNTLLLECEDNEHVYISGLEFAKFKTNDKIIDYKSLMGNNMAPYAIMIGEQYTYFMYHRYKFIENDKIEEGILLNETNSSLDPYDYHVEKFGVGSIKKLDHTLIHTCWPGHGENEENEENDLIEEDEENEDLIEIDSTKGYNNEVGKIFYQKCVICYERDSVYEFRQCGHQCICEQCYQNKGDINILKCVVCRT